MKYPLSVQKMSQMRLFKKVTFANSKLELISYLNLLAGSNTGTSLLIITCGKKFNRVFLFNVNLHHY